MNINTIIAIERDGLDVRVLTIPVQVNDESIDLREAVRKACAYYAKTEEGRKTYEYNCHCFNWADFEAEVPNEICRKFGFEKLEGNTGDITVNWDEQLVDDSDLEEGE